MYTRFVVHILHMCGQLVVWAAAFGTTSALGATSGKAHVRNTPAAAVVSRFSPPGGSAVLFLLQK